jgi:hypothetical protein
MAPIRQIQARKAHIKNSAYEVLITVKGWQQKESEYVKMDILDMSKWTWTE